MGIQSDIKKIYERLDEAEATTKKKKEKKPKKFKIPFSKRVTPTLAKKNFVTVIKINENGHIAFERDKIVEQTIIVDGIPRLATPEYVLSHKRNPVMIQPSWSVKPFCPKEHVKTSITDGSNTTGYKILMARMKSDTLGVRKPVGNMIKWIGGLVFAVIIGYALMTGGG